MTVGEIEEIFTNLDYNMSGYIDYTGILYFEVEFVNASLRKNLIVRKQNLE
jgi:hypothetical protein